MQYSSIDTSPVSQYVMHPFWNWLVEVCMQIDFVANQYHLTFCYVSLLSDFCSISMGRCTI